MKIPKAVKLPSGSWRVSVMIDGRRVSITQPTKQDAEREAAALKAGVKKVKSKTRLTVGEAIDRYIESKNAVLSPSTILGYRKIRKNAFPELMPLLCSAVTQEKAQRAVNKMARDKSPKSVRNAYGLFTAAMAAEYPEARFCVTLPQKEAPKIKIPTMDEIRVLLADCKGTNFELPFLLAVWLGLRTSEIRGLTWDCIDGDVLTVKQAIVDGEDGPNLKQPKTFSGNRHLPIPPYILGLIQATPRKDEFIVHYSRNSLYKQLHRACIRCEIEPFRFHDLRHVNASAMLALNVPDKYAMERMGHASNHMLKSVYQHTMNEKSTAVANIVDHYFTEELLTELHTENEK